MVTVCHDNFRIVAFNRNDHTLTLFYGINFATVYNDPDMQKAKQYLLFSCDNNIIGSRDPLDF